MVLYICEGVVYQFQVGRSAKSCYSPEPPASFQRNKSWDSSIVKCDELPLPENSGILLTRRGEALDATLPSVQP